MNYRQLFNESRPEVRIHIADNGWLVYSVRPDMNPTYFGTEEAAVFNTAKDLGEYITKTAEKFEIAREAHKNIRPDVAQR